MKKALKPRAPVISIVPKTPPSHHVRLTPVLQVWAETKAKTYRSVAAWIVELVRETYEKEQTAKQRQAA